MKIKKVIIKNFRSIKEQEITCGGQTIFIGPNGAGKSTVLKALAAFFDLTFKPTTEDYFAHSTKNPIEITLIFTHFTSAEEEDFASRIHNDELAVTRSFGGENNEGGAYEGLILGCAEFAELRKVTKAGDRKPLYEKLQADGFDLPTFKNPELDEILAAWEKTNPTKCKYIKDGGNFFGAKHVGGGKLQKATNFIMIEAVRDVADDANDQKSSPIAQLMDLIVRSAMKQNDQIAKYQDKVNEEYAAMTSPAKFPQLGTLETALSTSLGTYYQDVGIKLDWKPTAGVSLPPPQARISFKEDGFDYPVEKAGNGVQRAFIISLLHQLLVAKTSTSAAANDNPDEDGEAVPAVPASTDLEKLPSVILAIEEPELYQHPTKQWHFSQVLRQLSSGALESTFGDVQVICCTHSPSFVPLSEFHNTRMTSKSVCEDTGVKQTQFRDASLVQVASMIEKAWEFVPGICSAESTFAMLHTFGTELSEGFFADGVILVEGVTDKFAIETMARLMGKDLNAQNIAVVSVGGKTNLDKPWMVFTQLGIPVYPVWDSDSDMTDAGERAKSAKNNKTLQRMLGFAATEIEEFPSGAAKTHACFLENLNNQLKADFGLAFNPAYQAALDKFGLPGGKAAKNPYIISDIVETLHKSGKSSPHLVDIVEAALDHLKPKKSKTKKAEAA